MLRITSADAVSRLPELIAKQAGNKKKAITSFPAAMLSV